MVMPMLYRDRIRLRAMSEKGNGTVSLSDIAQKPQSHNAIKWYVVWWQYR